MQVVSIQNQAIGLMQERRAQILKKLKEGNAEEAVVTGGNAFTESVWDKMLEQVDSYLEEVKAEQQIRFEKRDKEQEEKEILQKQFMQKEQQTRLNMKELLSERAGSMLNVPYGYLAENGVIEYEGVTFVCDEKRNAICLGDMTNEKNVINIPLSDGGCLKVNRDNLDDLAKAISMFSPEDIKRIMEAIATNTKCRQMQQEMDETIHSISGSTTIVSKENEADRVTAEQIAELFRDK
ncbi:MAG: hypothetical protein IKJ15_08115 [Lachnospiraceae bacterium]|nr:hypothetical protein [Lachnospiraceae bacterium]